MAPLSRLAFTTHGLPNMAMKKARLYKVNLDPLPSQHEIPTKMARAPPSGHRLSYTVRVHPLPTSASPYNLIAYERDEHGEPSPKDVLIYIGGLTSGPHTTEMSDCLSYKTMGSETYGLNYSFWELRMRGSFSGWGHGSLREDVEDLAALVEWLKGGFGGEMGKKGRRIVLVGSSSGMYFPSSTLRNGIGADMFSRMSSDNDICAHALRPSC